MRAGDGTTNDTPPRLRASARINLLRAWWLRSWTPAFAGERLGAGRMRASPRPRLLYDAGVTASSDAAARKSVVQGKSVAVRVDLGGRRIMKHKTKPKSNTKICQDKNNR